MSAPNQKCSETFAQAVRRPASLSGKFRSSVRNTVLSASALLPPRRGSSHFVRGLFAHYVFDDQRELFERQIKELLNLGEFVNTDDMVAMVKGEIPLDGRYFHLSFDDGLDCLARNAAPILNRWAVPAIVFVNSAVTGQCSEHTRREWEVATNYKIPLKVMDWETLATSGFEIGAHTRTHRRLSAISGDRESLESEIHGCKTDIEQMLNRECRYFAWPFGTLAAVDPRSMASIESAGFHAAFGGFRARITPGVTNPFVIPRQQIEVQWPLSHVRFFAEGGRERDYTAPAW